MILDYVRAVNGYVAEEKAVWTDLASDSVQSAVAVHWSLTCIG